MKDEKYEISYTTNFKVEVINQAFATNVQQRNWHKNGIDYFLKETMYHSLSMIQLLAVNRNNHRFIGQQASECTQDMNKRYNVDKKKQVAKTKGVFIDGEQNNIQDLLNVTSNYMTFMKYRYVNASDTKIYKQF